MLRLVNSYIMWEGYLLIAINQYFPFTFLSLCAL